MPPHPPKQRTLCPRRAWIIAPRQPRLGVRYPAAWDPIETVRDRALHDRWPRVGRWSCSPLIRPTLASLEGKIVDVARLVGCLVLLVVGIVPGVLLDLADSGMMGAVLSYLALALAISLIIGTARAANRGVLSTLTLIISVGASLLWGLWSLMATVRLLSS